MCRAVLAALLVSACGGSHALPDAAPDAGSLHCPGVPADYPPMCAATCGNSAIDDCTTAHPGGEHCTTYTHGPEPCDGTLVTASCTDLGYYGGTLGCGSQCALVDHDCNACAVACTSYATGPTWVAAASGTHLGVVREPIAPAGSWTFAVLDATLAETATATIEEPYGIAGVPAGWLLVGPTLMITPVDTSGVVGPPVQLSAPSGIITSFVSGPGGRALLLWNELVAPEMPRVWAAVVNPDATIAVAPFVLFDETSTPEIATATSDGTSFFVAAKGRLVRLAPDGTTQPVVSGFPTEGSNLNGFPVAISWSGSTGWYIVADDALEMRYTAQKFDATGAKVGAPFPIATTTRVFGLQAYGTGLIGASLADISNTSWRFAVARFDATGAQVASTEVGLSQTTSPGVLPFGSGAVASWYGAGHQQFALVAP